MISHIISGIWLPVSGIWFPILCSDSAFVIVSTFVTSISCSFAVVLFICLTSRKFNLTSGIHLLSVRKSETCYILLMSMPATIQIMKKKTPGKLSKYPRGVRENPSSKCEIHSWTPLQVQGIMFDHVGGGDFLFPWMCKAKKCNAKTFSIWKRKQVT